MGKQEGPLFHSTYHEVIGNYCEDNLPFFKQAATIVGEGNIKITVLNQAGENYPFQLENGRTVVGQVQEGMLRIQIGYDTIAGIRDLSDFWAEVKNLREQSEQQNK